MLILVVNAMSASKKENHALLSNLNRIIFDIFQEILFWKMDSVVKKE